jgi:hypothetical protein
VRDTKPEAIHLSSDAEQPLHTLTIDSNIMADSFSTGYKTISLCMSQGWLLTYHLAFLLDFFIRLVH